MNANSQPGRWLRRTLAMALVALLVLCSCGTEALANTLIKVRVQAEYCNVYKSPSTESELLRKAPQNSLMTVGMIKDDWCYVKYDGTVGYALKSKLTTDLNVPGQEPVAPAPEATPLPTPEIGENDSTNSAEPTPPPADTAPEAAKGIVAITTSEFPLYEKADSASAPLVTIPAGAAVICTKVSGDWARILFNGTEGYVPKALLQPVEEEKDDNMLPENTEMPGDEKLICYTAKDTYLYSACSTESEPITALRKGTKVLVTQVKSGWAKLYTTDSRLGYLPTSLLSKAAIEPEKQVVLADWFESDIQEILGRGTYAKVVDVETGLSFNVRRKGGINHADMETVSTSDTKTMLSLYGGVESWDRRAIWVVIDGVYYAASMNGKGHGEETGLDNGLEGHFCIHFLNSRTHGTDNVCPLHQACVKQAYLAKP